MIWLFLLVTTLAQEETANAKPDPVLSLPSDPSLESEATVKQLLVGGTLQLDHLGPIVINKDGTLSRVQNWDSLAPIEQERAKAKIIKRNKERREILQKRFDEQQTAQKDL